MAKVKPFNQTITGTSANAYPSPPQYENDRIGYMNHKSVMIQNTDGSNSIDYKITVYQTTNSTGVDYPLDGSGNTEKSLPSGQYALINIPETILQTDVSVKSTVTDSHGTFEITMTGSTT